MYSGHGWLQRDAGCDSDEGVVGGWHVWSAGQVHIQHRGCHSHIACWWTQWIGRFHQVSTNKINASSILEFYKIHGKLCILCMWVEWHAFLLPISQNIYLLHFTMLNCLLHSLISATFLLAAPKRKRVLLRVVVAVRSCWWPSETGMASTERSYSLPRSGRGLRSMLSCRIPVRYHYKLVVQSFCKHSVVLLVLIHMYNLINDRPV